ncbi:MAG: hypothetical protein MZU97_02325 [Bacillus subtilis]|nr:hypothetical protein [Bacillus subtilis]
MQDSSNDAVTGDNSEGSTSNFLTAMGLITSGGDSLSSQTLGNNAKFYLNDSTTAQFANSNVLTSDITGITGLTITLKSASETKTANINVEQDTEALTSAMLTALYQSLTI